MLHPLISLWRHSCRVTFYDSAGAAPGSPFPALGDSQFGTPMGQRRRFRTLPEAVSYLRYWVGDASARAQLHWMLGKAGLTLAARRGGPLAWIETLGGMLLSGTLVVVEETARATHPGRLVAPPSAGAGALAGMPSLDDLPQIPRLENLLPALENIRIEGAEVLPELDQAMDEIGATLDTIGSAGASVEPAPSKVGDIASAMTSAASGSTQALDEA